MLYLQSYSVIFQKSTSQPTNLPLLRTRGGGCNTARDADLSVKDESCLNKELEFANFFPIAIFPRILFSQDLELISLMVHNTAERNTLCFLLSCQCNHN